MIDNDAAGNTISVNEQTMVALLDLSGKLAALAVAVEGYAIAVDGLNAISATPTLADSVGSILNLSYDIGVMANRILEEIGLKVAASAGAACHSDTVEISHVLESMNVPLEWAKGTLRFSVGRMTTAEEIDKAIEFVTRAVKKLRIEKP